MSILSSIPKRKHPVLQDRVLQILSDFTVAFNPLSQGPNTVTLQNISPKRNQILGCIPGYGIKLAKSHRDKALREYQISPTISKWRKLTEACQRLHHVHALTNQQGVAI